MYHRWYINWKQNCDVVSSQALIFTPSVVSAGLQADAKARSKVLKQGKTDDDLARKEEIDVVVRQE